MELLPKQKELVEWMTPPPGIASDGARYAFVVWLMRSGKTLPVTKWISLRPTGEKILIICPPKVVPVWRKHLRLFPRRLGVKVLSEGQLRKELNTVKRIGADWHTVIVDELHGYRFNSARYKELKKISKHAKFKIGLTGTPFDNRFSELYFPIAWLSNGSIFGEKMTKQKFLQSYCYKENPFMKWSPWEIRPEVKQDFFDALKTFTSIWRNEKVKPPNHYNTEYMLTRMQRSYVSKLMNSMMLPGLEGETAGLESMHRHDKVRQVYGGFFIMKTGDAIKICASYKWLTMMQLVRDLGGKRIVIWYRYLYEKDIILNKLQGRRIRALTLKTLEQFNNDEIDILVAHPKSAGAGIDISHADYAIFVTATPNWTALMQAFYRLARMDKGQKSIYHLVAKCKYDKKTQEDMWDKEEKTEEFYAQGEYAL